MKIEQTLLSEANRVKVVKWLDMKKTLTRAKCHSTESQIEFSIIRLTDSTKNRQKIENFNK